MVKFKILIDTNVVIGLEDARPVQASLAELVRLSATHSLGLYIDGATYQDIGRDSIQSRRAITLSKLAKFQRLGALPLKPESELVSRYGRISNDNDRCDVRLLEALESKAVDFLITQDNGIHRRALRAGLDSIVLTVEEALDWLRETFQEKLVALPFIAEQKAYQVDLSDEIFASLREDYPDFDQWFEKCRRQHRDCWSLQIDGKIAGLVVRKDESFIEAGVSYPGSKILKVCTFKVRDEFRGEKFGELLLKQILWFGQINEYDVIYLTVFPKHTFLRDLLAYYGFIGTKNLPSGELMMEKALLKGPIEVIPSDKFDFARTSYPRFYDGATALKFCVPIRPDYHRRLFPEIAFGAELPLFPNEKFGPVLRRGEARTPGNTIRKVYLSRAKTKRLRPGDLLLFYMSKDENYSSSQSVTTIAVAEQIFDAASTEDLIRLTAKRSVFSVEELAAMDASEKSPVKVIDFLLIGHFERPITLDALLTSQVFANAPPQSIAAISEEKYAILKPSLKLGFVF